MSNIGRDGMISSRALVVDDHAPTCTLIRDVLSAADIEAYGVTDSGSAAQRLLTEHYDAVFLDARMPSPDGIELTRQMRTAGVNRKTLIVMITGDTQQNFLKQAFDAGVDFVLFKPVDRQALLRLLRATQGLIDRERRRYTRVNVCRKVMIKFGEEHSRGTTENLSVNGFLAKMDRQFPVGSRVRISLDLNSGELPLLTGARVVRLVAGNTIGVELDALPAADSERLQEFLAAHILQSEAHTPIHASL